MSRLWFGIAALASLSACGCTAPSQAARQHASAAPPPGPRGIISSFPPQDTSFTPLRCLTYGPNTECRRDPD